MTQIPVISINLSGLEENPGFKITPDLAIRLCYAAEFGDIMMKCIIRMRPYEQKKVQQTGFIRNGKRSVLILFQQNA